MQVIKKYKMLIGSQWIDSSSGEYLDVIYPYTGEIWARVPKGTVQDVDRAVACAREAFDSSTWSELNPSDRRRLLINLGQLVEKNTDRLARLETMQNGKLLREMKGQIKEIPEYFYYFAGLADKIEGRTIGYRRDFLVYTLREPLGVVVAITPWNSPLLTLTFKLAPGLAAGNTFVIKPSQHTPVSTLDFCNLVAKAGFPPGVVNVVTGLSRDIGDELTKHPRIDKISLTGGTDTGIEIAKNAISHIAKLTLELGGKSPNIVFEDADIDAAINGVVAGIFAATGQTCVAGSRLLVQESVYDRFMEKLVKRTRTIRMGDPMKASTEIGPVAFKEQLEKVQNYIEMGIAQGGRILYGGRRPSNRRLSKGLFIEPTIFEGVRSGDKIVKEEIFGPVLCAMKFKNEEDAIRLANDTEYGLASGVWTKDVRRAHRMAKRIRAGTVWVNYYRSLSYAVPFGGFKRSGIGRENGQDAINEYTQIKSVWVDLEGHSRDPFKIG